MICSSGGSIGSGLYIVASHGGSPSGLLMAVLGRSSSPDRVPGLWAVVGVVLPLGFVVFRTVADTFRPEPVFGGESGVALVRFLVGDPVFELTICLEGTGVTTNADSLSSCARGLPVLPRLTLTFGAGIPSSRVILLLMVRFLAIGVSRSIRS
jgi:hypothetical protein